MGRRIGVNEWPVKIGNRFLIVNCAGIVYPFKQLFHLAGLLV
jgi:hypothetical protein